MSRICGACNKPCGTAHDCISCGKPVHSTVLCDSVWMPGEGRYFCGKESTPARLFKKFNYRVVWADTAKGPTSLRVENYAHGSDAALDSWVVLERKEGGAGGAE